MDIHIDLEAVKFFVVLVIAGSLYGYYVYRQGIKIGWDDAMYTLENEGLIEIDDEGKINRVSDTQFKKFQQEIGEFE